MLYHRHTILCFVSLVALTSVACGQYPIVPVDHPVYPFLKRMEAQGLISGYFDTALPLDQGQVCQFLEQVHHSLTELNSVDRSWLGYFQQEFWDWDWADTTGIKPSAGWESLKELGFFHWLNFGNFWGRSHDWFSGSGETSTWAINPILRTDIVCDDRYTNAIWRRTSGISLRLVWKSRMGLFFRFHDTTERGNGPYWTRSQVYDDRYGYIGPLLGDDFTYYDRTDYGMHFRWGRIRLEAGKWQDRWGPGQYGHLMLSDEGTSFDQVRLKVDIGNWGQFTALTGALKQYPPIMDTLYASATGEVRIINASKFVSAHRLDLKPFRTLQVGFSEMVIYGDRVMELGYVIPLNLYYSAQHYYGDLDNLMWTIDAKFTGIRGMRWYGEFLIDDITLSKLGTSYWGNKLAVLVGGRWSDPIGLHDLSVGSELTLIRPFVYSHQYMINIPTHWTRFLGHWSPPNSLTWTVGGDYQPIRSIQLSSRFDYLKRGVNTYDRNVGSNPYYYHHPGDPEYVSFLAGAILESWSVSGSVSWEFLPRFRAMVSGGTGSSPGEEYNWVQAGFYLNY